MEREGVKPIFLGVIDSDHLGSHTARPNLPFFPRVQMCISVSLGHHQETSPQSPKHKWMVPESRGQQRRWSLELSSTGSPTCFCIGGGHSLRRPEMTSDWA